MTEKICACSYHEPSYKSHASLIYNHVLVYTYSTVALQIFRIIFLISRLGSNNFTEEGKKQLRQAAEERRSYPDFVELHLYL